MGDDSVKVNLPTYPLVFLLSKRAKNVQYSGVAGSFSQLRILQQSRKSARTIGRQHGQTHREPPGVCRLPATSGMDCQPAEGPQKIRLRCPTPRQQAPWWFREELGSSRDSDYRETGTGTRSTAPRMGTTGKGGWLGEGVLCPAL